MAAGPVPLRARWIGAGAAVAAYAFASHALMTRAEDSAWSLAVVLGPLLALGLAWAWGTGHRILAAVGALAALLLGLHAASGHALPSRWLYLAQHAGIHLALALVFGATLRRGREPLVSGIARRLHREFTPALARYTRQVTLAWTLYFVAIAAASVALFLSGAFAAWSLLANVLTPVFTAAMFAGEYLLRYRLHPEFDRVGIQQAIAAYRSRGTTGAPRP